MEDRFRFRGKRKDNGDWVYGAVIKNPIPESLTIVTEITNDDIESYIVIPESVGQCTSIKFKNGIKGKKKKLVFEGDIVKYFAHRNYVGIVKFGKYEHRDTQIGFYIEWKGLVKEELRSDLIFWIDDRKVVGIGNKFEDPELLEGK